MCVLYVFVCMYVCMYVFMYVDAVCMYVVCVYVSTYVFMFVFQPPLPLYPMTAPDDYTAVQREVLFNPDTFMQTVMISIQNDQVSESPESFAVELQIAPNLPRIQIGQNSRSIVTIIDDDEASGPSCPSCPSRPSCPSCELRGFTKMQI